jgi:cation-transporting ATPase 13A1
LYNPDKKNFAPIPFPIQESIGFYRTSEGITNEQEERKAELVWGQNKLDIPIPKFFDVYKEHLVAPFFVFQIFCSALWLLDEYWYFSLFTLGMLFVFEGTVVM